MMQLTSWTAYIWRLRSNGCNAPVHKVANDGDDGEYRCMGCDCVIRLHPMDLRSLAYWHQLAPGERDGWSDVLEIMWP